MDPNPLWEIAIILVLIFANGYFAAAEIAIIAASRGTLQRRADEGDGSSRIALELAENPSKFLPTVQVGITLVGTFAAAFGGAKLGAYIETNLLHTEMTWLVAYRQTIALTVVALGIAFAQVILGELVPKRLALQNATDLSRWVALPMHWLARIARPVVLFMAWCTDSLLYLFGHKAGAKPEVSVEDIEGLIQTAGEVLDQKEQKMALEALRLGDRIVRDVMQPRLDLDAIEVGTPPEEVLGTIAMAGYSRLPVYEGDLDHILGAVHIRDVIKSHYLNVPLNLRRLLHPLPMVPETLPLDRLLVVLQEQRSHMAVVLDEFGGTQGVVTLLDVIEELMGKVRDEHAHDEENRVVRRDDGSYLVDGSLSFDEFLDALEIKPAVAIISRRFTTVAGLILTQLGHIPKVGQAIQWEGWRLEVVDMDGPRIDRLLVGRAEALPPASSSGDGVPS